MDHAVVLEPGLVQCDRGQEGVEGQQLPSIESRERVQFGGRVSSGAELDALGQQ